MTVFCAATVDDVQCSKVLSGGHKPSSHTLCAKHRAEKAAGRPFTAYRRYRRARGEPCTAQGRGWVCALPQFQGSDVCKSHRYQQYQGVSELKPVLQVAPESRNSAGEKHCHVCDLWRDPNDFEISQTTRLRPDGLRSVCRPCHYLRGYGITGADYERMLEDQGGKCAICGTAEAGTNSSSPIKRFAIDHDHACCPQSSRSCGKCVRGLLCRSCNVSLGTVQDNTNTLISMIEYLVIHREEASD